MKRCKCYLGYYFEQGQPIPEDLPKTCQYADSDDPTAGCHGEGKVPVTLSEESIRLLKEKWDEIIKKRTGCDTYDDFAEKLINNPLRSTSTGFGSRDSPVYVEEDGKPALTLSPDNVDDNVLISTKGPNVDEDGEIAPPPPPLPPSAGNGVEENPDAEVRRRRLPETYDSLRPSEQALARQSMINRPTTHIRVLEDLMEEINRLNRN